MIFNIITYASWTSGDESDMGGDTLPLNATIKTAAIFLIITCILWFGGSLLAIYAVSRFLTKFLKVY